jgi:hypothetical protein
LKIISKIKSSLIKDEAVEEEEELSERSLVQTWQKEKRQEDLAGCKQFVWNMKQIQMFKICLNSKAIDNRLPNLFVENIDIWQSSIQAIQERNSVEKIPNEIPTIY